MSTKQQYSDQSIEKLEGADRVRKKPSVIFGSDGIDGCAHTFFEILSNSVDEAREGHGDTITVTVFPDHSISVEDEGRGVPVGYNSKYNCYNWELVYCELYAGAKYNNNKSSGAYKYSLGLNGLGACATQYTSEFFEVYSYSNNTESYISFEKGLPTSSLITKPSDHHSGTITHWKPDIEVFTDINIPESYFTTTLQRQAVINAGIHFNLITPNQTQSYYYLNGIVDYIAEKTQNNILTDITYWQLKEIEGKDRDDRDPYLFKADIAFCMSNTHPFLEYYHNSSFLEYGGSPDKAVRTAFVYAIDKHIKTLQKYKKNESKITFQDIEDSLSLVINSFSTIASYENQTKKAITNSFIAEALTTFIKENLETYLIENPLMAEKIINQVLINKRAREHVEKERLSIKKKLTAATDVSSRVEKFVPCRSKDPSRRELYIVEGDSAMTSCKLGRDAEFQAIIPVRGKTLNCQKASYERIFKSDIIVDLLRVIGCGVELSKKVKTDMPPFNPDSLRWSKIIICTDADEDGFQIRTLLLTLFNRLLPTLIKEGRIYIAESPLFEITTKGKTYFAYNEQEKQKIISGLSHYTLQRSKGLGENEPEMMWETTMNPATRRLIRITPSEAQATERIFDLLLGDDLQGRKEFIAKNGAKYASKADT